MMPRAFRLSALCVAAAAAACSALVAASPAHAAPWDGLDVDFGPARWSFQSSPFWLSDAALLLPGPVTVSTDIWDAMGRTGIVIDALSVDEDVACASDAEVDIAVDGATGDLVLTCTSSSSTFAAAQLAVTSEIRVLAGGEIVRFLTTITNLDDTAVTIDRVDLYNDFGSTGYLYDFEDQSDSPLGVPVLETVNLANELNFVEADWIVHWQQDDAPGGLIIGGGASPVAAEWTNIAGGTYEAVVNTFSIPAGESRAVVSFATWDPQTLIDGGYTNSSPPSALLNGSADQIVADMAPFAQLSGVLANGLDPAVPVVNWGPAESKPDDGELAESGASAMVPVGLLATALTVVGAALVLRRRPVGSSASV